MAIKKQFSSLEDLIKYSSQPVFVCFYANWCSTSQSYAPVLEQLKTQMGNQIQVVKINTDKYPELAAKHEIKALPTSLLFIEGELACRIKGIMQTPQLIPYLQKFL
ncbi:MAG: thioredoxin domain-containing protein [Cyanobacteria bacterium J06592_8]